MEYNLLGNTDLKVSKVCLGTMTFGEQNSQSEGFEQMDLAVDMGINFFDTAEMYAVPKSARTSGLTETIIGNWIEKGNRNKIVLATKITGPDEEAQSWIRNPLNFTKNQIKDAIEGSLRRLKTDYVDIYQLHWPERKANYFGKLGYSHDANDPWKDNFLEVIESMTGLIRDGKIRYFGLSNETPWGVMKYFQLAEKHSLPRPISIQNPYSLLNRSFEVGLSEISIRENFPLLGYSPLAFGLLSGKYHNGTDSPENRLNKFGKILPRYSGITAYNATEEYIRIAKNNHLSMTQMALAFVNDQKFVGSNIIGATSTNQLKENIESINIKLSKEIVNEINIIHQKISNPAP